MLKLKPVSNSATKILLYLAPKSYLSVILKHDDEAVNEAGGVASANISIEMTRPLKKIVAFQRWNFARGKKQWRSGCYEANDEAHWRGW